MEVKAHTTWISVAQLGRAPKNTQLVIDRVLLNDQRGTSHLGYPCYRFESRQPHPWGCSSIG